MKGLLVKDLYVIKSYGLWIVLVNIIFIAISVIQSTDVYILFTAMYSAMISVNTMAYDERGHWDTYADSLPVSRKSVVISKYMSPFVVMMSVWILYIAGKLIAGIFTERAMLPADILSESALIWTSWSFIISVLYPALFKAGVEKGKIAYMIMIMVVSGVSGGFFAAVGDISGNIGAADVITPGIALIMILASVVLVMLSVNVSIHFYNKRDL